MPPRRPPSWRSRAEAAYAEVAHLRERVLDVDLLRGLELGARALDEQLARVGLLVSSLEAPVAATVTSGSRTAAELGEELRRLASLEAAAQDEASQSTQAAQAAEMVVPASGAPSTRLGSTSSSTVLPWRRRPRLRSRWRDASRAASEAANKAALQMRFSSSGHRGARVSMWICSEGSLPRSTRSATTSRAAAIGEHLEAPVRARADAGAMRATELGAELRQLGAEEVGLRARAEQATGRATSVEVELARLDGEAEEAQRRLNDARVATSEVDAPDEVDQAEADSVSRDELALRINRLEARREALGRVNPLAREEYEAEKERLDELAMQRKDLEWFCPAQGLEYVLRSLRCIASSSSRSFSASYSSFARGLTRPSASRRASSLLIRSASSSRETESAWPGRPHPARPPQTSRRARR